MWRFGLSVCFGVVDPKRIELQLLPPSLQYDPKELKPSRLFIMNRQGRNGDPTTPNARTQVVTVSPLAPRKASAESLTVAMSLPRPSKVKEKPEAVPVGTNAAEANSELPNSIMKSHSRGAPALCCTVPAATGPVRSNAGELLLLRP